VRAPRIITDTVPISPNLVWVNQRTVQVVSKPQYLVSNQDDRIAGCGINGFVLRLGNNERKMFDWIDIVVMRSLPLAFVECQYTRRIAKLKPVSVKTIRQNILSLSELMKDKDKADIPNKFVVVFDGWSEGTEHYIAVSAAYARMDKTTARKCQSK
jgi:hypothetical protein